MKREVVAYEAQTHLPELLQEVLLKGQRITIKKRGVAVAELGPVQKKEKKVRSVIEDFRKWRQGISWGKGMSTESAKEEGRRYTMHEHVTNF